MISSKSQRLFNPDGSTKTIFNPSNFTNNDLRDTKLFEPELTDPKFIGNVNYSSTTLASDINNKLPINNPNFTGVMTGTTINPTNLLIPQSAGGVYFYGSTTSNQAARFSYSASNILYWDSYTNANIQFRFGTSPIMKHQFFNNGDVSFTGNITSPTITTINSNINLKVNQTQFDSELASIDSRIDLLEGSNNVSFSNLTGISSTTETNISLKRFYYADVGSANCELILPSLHISNDSKSNGWLITIRSRQAVANSFKLTINCSTIGRFFYLGEGTSVYNSIDVSANGSLSLLTVNGTYFVINKQDS